MDFADMIAETILAANKKNEKIVINLDNFLKFM